MHAFYNLDPRHPQAQIMQSVLHHPTRPRSPRDFLIRITDESLSGVGIRPNDLLRVRRQWPQRSGDLVVFEPSPQVLLVMFLHFESDGRYRFEGASPDCPVRRYHPEEVTIRGVVQLEVV